MYKLEKSMEDLFVKKAPFQLPENAKKMIVEWSPWINLVLGLFALWAAKWLWDIGHNPVINYLNDLSRAFGGTEAVTPTLGLFYWLAVLALVVEAVLMLISVPGLKARSKSRGWNLAFYGAIFNLVYGVLYMFTSYGGGVGRFISTLIGSVIGFYFLFQIRSYYTDK